MSVARRRNIYPSLLSSNGCYVSNENTTNWSNVSPDPFTPLEADDGAMGLFCWLKVCLLVIVSAILISAHSNSCSAVTNGPRSSPDEFDFRNARTHLQKITALGPRTAGSLANEVAAPAYLRNELRDIALLANQSGLVALVEEQVSGPSSFRAQFHMSTYDNLRNFVLRFHDPKEGDAAWRSAFLVNCHYDSAIGSPGASDAFVSCAILLECGRALSTGKFQLKNDIIFLFNGAEENILPSSHAFITQHEWAKDIKAFLNLEGAGAGGRLMVFQVGPGKGSNILMSAYSQSFRQPYATVVAEELFQSGAIPSDTDYRIFRDFGGVPGIDMAYISDGYAYHTPFDTEARISCECLQRAGLDTLKFVTVVAKDERIKTIPRLIPVPPSKHESELTNEASSADVQLSMTPKSKVRMPSKNRIVYFDVQGLAVVRVPWGIWRSFNLIFSLVVCWWVARGRRLSLRSWLGLSLGLIFQVISQFFGLLFICIVGTLVHNFGCRMTWYAARYNLVGVFVFPLCWWFTWFFTYLCHVPDGALFRTCRIHRPFVLCGWIKSRKLSSRTIERDFFDAALLVLLLETIVLCFIQSLTVFPSTIWLAYSLAGRAVYERLFYKGRVKYFVNLLLTLMPTFWFFHVYFSVTFMDFLIPVLGRAGDGIKPDVLISICIFYFTFPLTMFCAGPLLCTSANNGRILRLVLLNACLSYAVLVHASPYGFPYSLSLDPHPNKSPRYQRLAVFHMQRTFRDIPDNEQVTMSDSHVSVTPLDVNGIRYLKPNSYPASIPASVLALLYTSEEQRRLYGGVAELVGMKPSFCNYSQPYCGTASLYPYLHYFSESYLIPTTPHESEPHVSIRLVSRRSLNTSTETNRRVWNFTFSVTSGPPNTHVFVRTDVPRVRLSNWSFPIDTPYPVPMPLPTARTHDLKAVGAHYYIYHINPAAVNSYNTSWFDPWNFWLIVDSLPNTPSNFFDIAVTGIYMDEKLSSSSSPQLEDIVSRLPPWVTTMQGCATYKHYRFSV